MRQILFVIMALVSFSAVAQTYSESVLHNFCAETGCPDGYPNSSTVETAMDLIQAADGNFYGTTANGGLPNSGENGSYCFQSQGCGTVFKISPTGKFTTIYTFCSKPGCTDGGFPLGGLVQGGDGNFYGTTYEGGIPEPCNQSDTVGCGTVFKLTPSGMLTTLFTFPGETNGLPSAALIQGDDGNFYGTTDGIYDNTGSYGSVFRITPAGDLTELYSFCPDQSANCPDGYLPEGGLVEGSDGAFYGTTYGSATGASSNADGNPGGTVYKVTPSGAFSLLYSFCSSADCTDGSTPTTPLIEGANGNLYGVTGFGGAKGAGTFFDISPSGDFQSIYSLYQTPQSFGYPQHLTLASDGNYYGNAVGGGNTNIYCEDDISGCGAAFRITSTGEFTDIYEWCSLTDCSDGAIALTLSQGSDGNFYGFTPIGGSFETSCPATFPENNDYTYECGTIFKIAVSPALPAPVQVSLSSATVALGGTSKLTYQALNAFSMTMQQCYLFATLDGTEYALGKVAGTLANNIYSGSTELTPPLTGTYNMAVTCGGVESGFATLTVSPYSSEAALSATASPMVGEPLTLRSTITGSHGTPTGTVTFNYGTFALGTVPLSNGTASLSVSTADLPAQTYPLTATYSGSGTYGSSTSTTYDLELAAATTSTTLAVSPSTLTPGMPVKFTATVARSASGATGKPSGNVTFSYAGITLGTSAIGSNGQASLTLPTNGLEAGNYAITATYSGDAGDAVSASKAQTVTVQ